IPLGKSFDEVIERALAESKCVIVLWSAVSVASEWVRNEASEAKRRGILVPVFLETVDAPLAFRLLNGADLHDWQPGTPHGEFDKLVEHVKELLANPASTAPLGSGRGTGYLQSEQRGEHARKPLWIRYSVVLGAVAALVVAALFVYSKNGKNDGPDKSKPSSDAKTSAPQVTPPDFNLSELEKALQGLPRLAGGVPATAVTTAFHLPDLGLRVAFVGPEQIPATLGAMPPGALVMEVESSGAASKAGIHVFDIIEGIGGRKIETVDDLRQSLRKIGPGKTQFTIRRPNGQKTVSVNCPNCKPE
ncbi:MAG TPA: TIR domain-containing protein, partial [Terriglobales bacterium]|nr:TIR domain-containing protein [Terriglobales bacterium]